MGLLFPFIHPSVSYSLHCSFCLVPPFVPTSSSQLHQPSLSIPLLLVLMNVRMSVSDAPRQVPPPSRSHGNGQILPYNYLFAQIHMKKWSSKNQRFERKLHFPLVTSLSLSTLTFPLFPLFFSCYCFLLVFFFFF